MKGSEDVHTITSCEKGENVSQKACCDVGGNFIPPVLIFKGWKEKKEFCDGLPPGSKAYMNKKSSIISSEIFFRRITPFCSTKAIWKTPPYSRWPRFT
jgi:hypothetical protein